MSITAFAEPEFTLAVNTTPRNIGPGTYQIDIKSIPQETIFPFSSTVRRELWNIPDQPNVGPGCYNTSRKEKTKGSTMPKDRHNRDYFMDYQQSPSPADQAPIKEWGAKVKKKKRSETAMRNRPRFYKREVQPQQELQITPGPCDYNTNTEATVRGVSVFSKSRTPQREPAKYNGVPGPGRYGKIENNNIPNRPSPAFKSKKRGELFVTPDYDATMKTHVAWDVGENDRRPFGSNTAREFQLGAVDTPSPDTYDTAGMTSRNTKTGILSVKSPNNGITPIGKNVKQMRGAFGTSRNFYDYAMNENPGPGYYGELKPTVSKTRPSSANKAQLKDLWTSDFITPSAPDYDITRTGFEEEKVKLRTPSPQFKGEPVLRDCLTNHDPNPGPAYYVKVQSSRRKNTIPKRARYREGEFISGVKMNKNPSPADYDWQKGKESKTTGGFIRKNARFDPKDRTPKVTPTSYQNGKSDLIKPSYNVRFDSALKVSSKYKS